MDLIFCGQTHHTLGGCPISWLGALLMDEIPSFGPAIERIQLTVFYPGKSERANYSIPYRPPEKDTRRFERKRKTLRILWISRRQSEALVGELYLPDATSEILLGAFEDAIDALRFALERVTKSDGFDKQAFLSWVLEKKALPWGDDDALRAILSEASDKMHAKWQAQKAADPWSVLDIDWSKMAPNARKILDEPGDWSEGDDFSPHGNDTGADIFYMWSRYARLTPERAVKKIGWGNEFDLSDDICWQEWVKINLALAFGHIKKTGHCPSEIASTAHKVLSEEISRASEACDWGHLEEYRTRMERYCKILSGFT